MSACIFFRGRTAGFIWAHRYYAPDFVGLETKRHGPPNAGQGHHIVQLFNNSRHLQRVNHCLTSAPMEQISGIS